ncbi:MAG: response regulator transcription factor [Cryobacterium sp.]|jgi:two-component system OmpR family response regulator|nr:response regulator transcription factor [Cryobacterium sp.]
MPLVTSASILVVEDDADMRALLHQGLEADGYEVTVVSNGVDALIAQSGARFAVAVVDVMLPGMSGFELCRRLRESAPSMRTLLLTARNSVEDRVFGLDAGADDYLTKPFAFAELGARIRALLRRDATELIAVFGPLVIDTIAHVASLGTRKLSLSPKEFELLRFLSLRAGTAASRDQILDEVWGGTHNIDPNIVDQYVSYLRRKLSSGADAASGVEIRTVRGEGFRLEEVAP